MKGWSVGPFQSAAVGLVESRCERGTINVAPLSVVKSVIIHNVVRCMIRSG